MNCLSAAKGSNHLANGKSAARLLTISLFLFGAIMAGILGYQQFAKLELPDLISKDEAVRAALTAGNWNEQTLRDKKIDATLLHAKANGFSFIVDEKTLQDSLTLHHSVFPNAVEYESQYLWAVEITSSTRDWNYVISAETGEILLQG